MKLEPLHRRNSKILLLIIHNINSINFFKLCQIKFVSLLIVVGGRKANIWGGRSLSSLFLYSER